jgi:hypothetical protein
MQIIKNSTQVTSLKKITAMSQIRLYEYMFQMWRIDLYALCIRTFNHI